MSQNTWIDTSITSDIGVTDAGSNHLDQELILFRFTGEEILKLPL